MFQFEGYTLDFACGALRTADGDLHLRPKSFEVLLSITWPRFGRPSVTASKSSASNTSPWFTAPVLCVAESTPPAAPSPLGVWGRRIAAWQWTGAAACGTIGAGSDRVGGNLEPGDAS